MEYYTLLQSWPLHVVNREIFFCKINKIKIVGLRCLGKESYLVEVNRLLTDFLCEIDELEVVLWLALFFPFFSAAMYKA